MVGGMDYNLFYKKQHNREKKFFFVVLFSSFNFNKTKKSGIKEVKIGGKVLLEAVV